jgi:hypothetical protein
MTFTSMFASVGLALSLGLALSACMGSALS